MLHFKPRLRRQEYAADIESIEEHSRRLSTLGKLCLDETIPVERQGALQRGIALGKMLATTIHATLVEGNYAAKDLPVYKAEANLDSGAGLNEYEIRVLGDQHVGVIINPFA